MAGEPAEQRWQSALGEAVPPSAACFHDLGVCSAERMSAQGVRGAGGGAGAPTAGPGGDRDR